jgi:kynurenine formamidase
MSQRWKNRPEGSNWGDFGPDDQLGRLNLLTPDKVKQGISEVREGLNFCLSLPLNLPGGNLLNPRRYAPVLWPTQLDDEFYINYPSGRKNPAFADIISDDTVLLWTQYSSQWDALAHVGQMFDADGDGKPEMVYYNGYRAGEHIKGPTDYSQAEPQPTGHEYQGVDFLGIQNMAEKPIQGRAVLIDLHAHFGEERRFVDFADLKHIMDADNVVVEAGDMVCFHTGFAQLIMAMGGDPDPDVLHSACPVLDGRDPQLLQWISETNIAALCADNYAVEGHPAKPGEGECYAMLPLHEHCLFKLGVPLAELWYLSELAQWLRTRQRNRFLLTAPPLRLPGAVGSPVTPVATV